MSEEKLDILIDKVDKLATKKDIEVAIAVHTATCRPTKNVDIAKISGAVVGGLAALTGAIYGLIQALSG